MNRQTVCRFPSVAGIGRAGAGGSRLQSSRAPEQKSDYVVVARGRLKT